MKENIEEDIKILENFTEQTVLYGSTVGMTLEKYIDLQLSIKHILSDYKRVLKDNEELKIIKSAIQTLQINSIEDEKYIVISKSSFLDGSYKHLLDDYIPVQKVKAKIEELNIAISECEYLDDDDERYKKAVEKDKLCLLNQKRVLKQLLESEE